MTDGPTGRVAEDGAAGIAEDRKTAHVVDDGIAARIVDADEPLPMLSNDAEALALAWALKDHGYAAWSRDPAAAGRASAALDALVEATQAHVSAPTLQQLQAIATWMEGIAGLTRGRMSEAVLAFDRAALAFRAVDLPVQAARTQVPKIMALSVLGLHDRAADCGEAALAELRALGDMESAARVSLNLGNLHRRRNDFARASDCFRAAAVLSARLGDRERSVMADIGMADARASIGEVDEALRLFARAAMRARQHGYPVLEALVEESVALVDLARGRFGPALAGFEGARRRYAALAMPQHLAIAEKQLADAYLELRLLPEAARLFDQAMAHFEALEMPVEAAWTLLQRGRFDIAADPAANADVDDALTRAAALFEAQGVPAGLATVALARAERALFQGDPAAACQLAADAERRFAAAGLVDGRTRADATRAEALFATGRRIEAATLLAATRAEARRLRLLPVQVRCELVHGLAQVAAGHDGEARAAFEAAIALFEDQRDALPGDDLRQAFQVEHLRPYRELLRLALADAARSPSDGCAGAVLLALERFRARALGERLGQRLQPGPARSDDSVVARSIADLRTRLRWLDRRLRKANDEGDAGGRLVDEVRGTEHALLEAVRRQRLADTALAPRATDADFDVAALQAALPPDEALVEYGMQDDSLFACVVTHDRVSLVRGLAHGREVEDAVRDARFQIETLRQGGARMARHIDQLIRRADVHLGRLHALLWAPLVDAIGECRRVIVVPHERLGALPFPALHDGHAHLVDRMAIAMAPSARVALHGLRGSRQRRHASRRMLALGETASLQQAGEEARFVAGLFPTSQVLEGPAATAERLRADAPRFDLLHLACHASFRVDNPMFSALQLADGALTAESLEGLSLTAGIVTLSGCETGLAEVGRGDEVVGLVRAFLVSGAERVVASLWPVDDAVTREFMAHFYRALQAGEAPAAALRDAQLAIKRSHPHPFHWAPFQLHGGF